MKNVFKAMQGRKKALLIAAAAILAVLVATGVTLAFVLDSTDPVENEFTPSRAASEVIEDTFDGTVKSNVKLKNTGDTEAYLRAAIVITWMPADNDPDAQTVLASKPVLGTDYTLDLDTTDWIVGSDGYYYYKEPVAPNALTSNLITSCEAIGTPPDGYCLSVEIVSSAIQSTPASVVADMWGVTVSNGTITGK